MRVEELRLDNWIYSEILGEYTQIKSIIKNVELRIKPIELTEEILLSIEGVKQLNEYQYKFNDWFIIERYTTKEKWSIRKVISEDSSILLCFIDFLHELQNITFSLTNKELEINL